MIGSDQIFWTLSRGSGIAAVVLAVLLVVVVTNAVLVQRANAAHYRACSPQAPAPVHTDPRWPSPRTETSR